MRRRAYDWKGWRAWKNLSRLDLEAVSSGPGAYVIAADRPVGRAVGVDPHGFLDIGESGSLRQRFRDFLRCSGTKRQYGHMAGWRYCFFCFERHFPRDTLKVRWVETPTKAAAYASEGRLLLTYLRNHCELPPLNYKFNWDTFGDVAYGDIDE